MSGHSMSAVRRAASALARVAHWSPRIERVSRTYADHQFNGRTHFAAIADEIGPILMEKTLTANS